MKLGCVIGRVTLSTSVPALSGGRFLIVTPYTNDHMQRGSSPPPGLSRDYSTVVYDNLGAGLGDSVGFEEGREAAMPFEQPTPVDAFNAAIIDEVNYRPLP